MGALVKKNPTQAIMAVSKEGIAGVAGVLLVYAGYRHPGSLKAKLLLGLTGAGLAIAYLPSAVKEARDVLS